MEKLVLAILGTILIGIGEVIKDGDDEEKK